MTETTGPTIFGYTPAQVRKALVAFVTFVAIVVSTAVAVGGVIPLSALPFVQIFLAVLGQYGIFRVPNAD